MAESRLSSADASHSSRRVWVFDCRPQTKEGTKKMLDVGNMNHKQFMCAVRKEFSISANERFVITTTDRREIVSNIYNELPDGKALHLLTSVDQELFAATEEQINFVPHFHTIVQSGQYEYYASEGQKALPYAFAELIDNALSATSLNSGPRGIDIQLFFDESQGGPAVVVRDNGCGMTSKDLNNWAVYRLSKFNRDDRTFKSDKSGYVRPNAVPRSLNSDISYFGVGGKQAVFYIGQCVRIISKPIGSPDVHEFIMSKEDFEEKEKNKKEIFSGIIRNRKPGDDSHLKLAEERFLQPLVLEEKNKDSFTTVVITAVQPEHVSYLKKDFSSWTRVLAHIYHYYVHGIHGNVKDDRQTTETMSNLDIQICLFDRHNRLHKLLNLREIDDDMQTLYINSSKAEFEFKASKKGDAKVEGLIRYHPYLYDRETYPKNPAADKPESDDDDCFALPTEGRGKRPIFECFWNGRLIPYTSVDEFDWCAKSKKTNSVPLECYNRISGVLFTNDCFQVSTNKLTFMDLELKLRDKETIFTRVDNGQEHRVNITREFANWMNNCHEKYDKQVKFLGFQGPTTRTDVQSKSKQYPWTQFKAIMWDGKTYKTGQQIKTIKTQTTLYGTIEKILLYGHHEDDVYATGGVVQIAREPKELYNEVKSIPISKIDRQATQADIKERIENELDKLPDKLQVTWPDKNPWPENAIQPAGTRMGPIRVEILNKKGEKMSRLPVSSVISKKFQIDLKVVWHSENRDIETNSHICEHSAKWDYWFKEMKNFNKLGKYTLHLQVFASDGDFLMNECGGRALPSYKLHFSIKESTAAAFVVGGSPSSVQMGVPFALPLKFTDAFSHPTQSPSGIKPQLECSSLKLSYEKTNVSGTTFNIQDLKAMGKVTNHPEVHTVKVTIPGFNQDPQSFQISVRPGPPHHLLVKPADEVCIENGTSAEFKVEVQDEFHNITTHSKLIVRCQLFGTTDLPADTVDCSNTGSGSLLAKPIQLKNVTTECILTAKFAIPNQKAVPCVERIIRVSPSSHVFRMEVYRQEDDSGDFMVIQNKERVNWTAGDTLGSLRFRLYDEGGRKVPLTQKLVHNIKVNWAADIKPAELAKGRLPCVCVPAKAHGEHFYQVAFKGQHSVDTSFTIVPRPDEPERLRVTLSETTVRMGEPLSEIISVDVIDQHGNKTDALNAERLNAVSVSADNLDESALNFNWQTKTQTVVVTGVRFVDGTPGPRELCFKYQSFEEFVRVKVTAGPPAKITLLAAPAVPVHVVNGHGLDTPFLLQLCDDWGNPVLDQRVVISVKTSSQLKVKSTVMSQPVDTEGKASFILKTITGTTGEHELEFRGSFSERNIISGPVVKLRVLPDPQNPVKLSVKYDTEAILRAGDVFPVFKVAVLSEEGGPVKNVNPSCLSMMLWLGLASGSRPPSGAMELKCSKPQDTENDDHFYFRDKEIPARVGKYRVQFIFAVERSKTICSSHIVLNVVANKPVKLVPDSPASTPVVSNSPNLSDRTLLRALCLKIMDEHNNPAGMGINGKVILTVETEDGDDAEDLPMFENQTKSLTYDLINGETPITNLALMENSPGIDATVYVLKFSPVFEDTKSLATIPPFKLPFRFYNDAENQQVIATMCKKKDTLSQSIVYVKEIIATKKQLETELNGQVEHAAAKETQLKLEIQRTGIDISKLSDVKSVKNLHAQITADLERLQNLPRRKCIMPDRFKGTQDVLGKIAHLALVKDDHAAKVISWHIVGDMDCVVTVTTAAAKKIYDETQGLQQVMPLETIFWRQSNRPLPHIRNGQNLFLPLGNPVFARDLLIFPEHTENCKKVFANVLGDTILVDNLDSANHYRKGVVASKMQCPTLLTRQGDRIRSNGKFGGLQNKAPPIEKLKEHVFGAPLPQEYQTLCKQTELLQQYSLAMQQLLNMKADYNQHMEYESPRMLRSQQELQQQEQELGEIEKKLASTPVRASPGSVKRNLEEEIDESLPAKRIRRKTRRLLDY